MLDIDQLLRPMLAQFPTPPIETLPKVGINYSAYRQRVAAKKQYNLKFSYIENLVHRLGFRLRVQVLDTEGNVISAVTSEPEHPMITEEEIAERKARKPFSSGDERFDIVRNMALKRGYKTRMDRAAKNGEDE